MKVLLVEPNLLMQSRIKNALKNFDVRVGKDYSGEDIVLINAELSDPNLIKEFREKGAKVIAYCGHKNTDLIKKCYELGAHMVVPNSRMTNPEEVIKSLI
ncbi:hypothetical protein [Thermocrinis minervae]|uniref:Putative N-acetylmannosamine-6-phosphate epimerase n=1 Tax=Thermocrinis minervae TaxID=381751 RepID=A0A1M6THC5_9AQUI|nr:hypothetical protein [Thermocrinis minervae]SHK56314.1 Putative N-acetylmannosamine-6-phosphate epimerase [Thermocrinis minervae]